jgi:hypothetical protein
MRQLVLGGTAAILAVTVLALCTPPGHAALQAEERAVTAREIHLYHAGWVAAAWPVENALLLVAQQGGALTLPPLTPRQTRAATRGTASPARTTLIGWQDWERPGAKVRWRQLHAATARAAQVRQLVSLEFWLVPLLLLVVLAKPLLALTAGLGRLRPGTGHGSAHLASGRELRELRPRRGDAGLRLGRAG